MSARPSSSRMFTCRQAAPGHLCQKGLMPASLAKALNDQELSTVVQYLAGLPGKAVGRADADP